VQPRTCSPRTLLESVTGSGHLHASSTAHAVRMRIKTLCNFRSKPNPSKEMVTEALPILDPRTVWVLSTMTEAKI
jgi:hypothetical protein